jgi:hypothetical protein
LKPAPLIRFFGRANAEVEVAHFRVLGFAGRDRTKRCTAEESYLDVVREAVGIEEPALALNSVERGVPFDRLAYAGDGARDDRVEAAADVPFPARHGLDVGLYRVAVSLRDLMGGVDNPSARCDRGRGYPDHHRRHDGWNGHAPTLGRGNTLLVRNGQEMVAFRLRLAGS